jgi:2-polyprenyl-6-methoxyphenol hydroxylase-like FAD-dependent oxidoreductase
MPRKSLQVVIIGAGTGGLCLAQGLKAENIGVTVFERDRTPTDRLQGYRLSINEDGNRALRACLPPALHAQLIKYTARPSRAVSFLDHRLHRLLRIDLSAESGDADTIERPISRIALREVLLRGLGDTVRFDKRFTHFADDGTGRVTAFFDDGTSAAGDLLIGADGANSRVRAQLLPDAQRIETGLVIVSGKVALTDAVRAATPEALFLGPTLIIGPRGGFLFANAVEYDGRQVAGSPDREEYVMWGFSARRETYRLSVEPDEANDETLRRAVTAGMSDWHPDLVRMVQITPELDAFPAKTSVRVPPWRTRNVTLLGDALHNMTPYRGMGANTALRDAGALRTTLTAIADNRAELIPALADYERKMIRYGFAAVESSLKQMDRLHTESPIGRFKTKAMLRAADAVLSLKMRLMGA